MHEWKKANKEMQLPPYMEETREGFRLFCKEQHERYKGKQSKTELWRDIWKHPETKYLKNQEDGGVPCYSDFYRWVQWHNHAVTTTEYLGIPSYALHYEDFSTRFDETVSEIMEHMGKARIAPAPRFKTGKSYKEYFTEDELKKVKKAMKHLASENTWKIMERYFD